MPTEPAPITLAQVVHRAVEVCDPDGTDEDLSELLLRFEDADEPVTAVEDVELRMAEAVGSLDAEGDSAGLEMAAAVATYLAHRRDELDEEPDVLLRLAARAEFDGDPPEEVVSWLDERGVAV
jgi:hypothetical protein